MDDAGIAALKSAFAFSSLLNEWATAIVVAGVAIELFALLLFSKSMSLAEKAMLVTGSLLVVGGVGGEYVFGGRAASIASELQQASDQAVAGLKAQQEADHKIAIQAAAHAADLGVSIGTLHNFVDEEKRKNDDVIAELKTDQTRLSKARDDALTAATASKEVLAKMTAALDSERVVRAQMIAVLTPRDLSPPQQDVFKTRLALFAPTRVDILTFGDTKEIADFGRKLADTLELCGWVPKVWSVFGGASMGVTGVPIFARKESGEKADKAATALEGALHAQQLSAKKFDPFEGTTIPTSVNGPPWIETDVGDVRVFIGPKP